MDFDPLWELRIEDNQYHGRGLLHKPLWSLAGFFESFSVVVNRTQLIALPKQGKIVRNLAAPILCEPGKLIWFRRMQMIFDGRAPTTSCACYGIGIQIDDKRIGYRIFPDGRVKEGI